MCVDYAEFNHLRLAEAYDAFCPLGKDSDFFLNEVRKAHPKSVLDVGCGSGILTVELTDIAEEVTGVEPALPMLELARKRPGAEKSRVVAWFRQGR
jgi:ubiquinone/menaquinone biosynthesis C-methylase UbiE